MGERKRNLKCLGLLHVGSEFDQSSPFDFPISIPRLSQPERVKGVEASQFFKSLLWGHGCMAGLVDALQKVGVLARSEAVRSLFKKGSARGGCGWWPRANL